jgi:hypothetical protein
MTGSYEFRLRVALNPRGDLILTSRIKNINGKPFQFTFAYHTYFSVSDIRYIAKWHFAQSYFHNFLGFLECKKAEKTNRKLASILSRVFFLRHEWSFFFEEMMLNLSPLNSGCEFYYYFEWNPSPFVLEDKEIVYKNFLMFEFKPQALQPYLVLYE